MHSCLHCVMLMLILRMLSRVTVVCIAVRNPFQEAPYINAQCPGHILYLCLNEVLKILSWINMRRRTHKPDGQTINNAHTHSHTRCIGVISEQQHLDTVYLRLATHTHMSSISCHSFCSTARAPCAMSEIHLPNAFNMLAIIIMIKLVRVCNEGICSCVWMNQTVGLKRQRVTWTLPDYCNAAIRCKIISCEKQESSTKWNAKKINMDTTRMAMHSVKWKFNKWVCKNTHTQCNHDVNGENWFTNCLDWHFAEDL